MSAINVGILKLHIKMSNGKGNINIVMLKKKKTKPTCKSHTALILLKQESIFVLQARNTYSIDVLSNLFTRQDCAYMGTTKDMQNHWKSSIVA